MGNTTCRMRMLSYLLAAALLCFLPGCGNEKDGQGAQAPENNLQTEEPAEAQSGRTDPVSSEDTGGTVSGDKILIAYFTAAENSGVDAVSSASYTTIDGEAVGRVRAVADMIQTRTGGELFSIQTATVYPANGGELIDQAADEQDENVRPELTSHIESLDNYEVIFVGFPNWWYDMPMAMYSFFEEYDFSGKTIIPFNVHNGSRFSDTISTIQTLEPDASVIEDGFTVSESSVAEAEGDVLTWLENLGY